ncbi:MAG: 30S ribosomal protein S17 [Nanoarchaeota archaeon]
MKPRNIGVEVKAPKATNSSDSHDPFFKGLSLRGRIFTAKVLSANSSKTAKVEFTRLHSIPKYERFEKRRTRLQVHNPESINAQPGDMVRIMESRPISKTKNFIIIEKIEDESDKSKSN